MISLFEKKNGSFYNYKVFEAKRLAAKFKDVTRLKIEIYLFIYKQQSFPSSNHRNQKVIFKKMKLNFYFCF